MFRVFWTTLLVPLVSGIAVPIPLSATDDAPQVTGNLVSLSIEQDRKAVFALYFYFYSSQLGWLDWAGNTSRNSFFFNTLDNLVALTGSDPTIRIGYTRAFLIICRLKNIARGRLGGPHEFQRHRSVRSASLSPTNYNRPLPGGNKYRRRSQVS